MVVISTASSAMSVRASHDSDFTEMHRAWLRHCRSGRPSPTALHDTHAAGLAAACLHLANRPNDEIVGWTLNLPAPPRMSS